MKLCKLLTLLSLTASLDPILIQWVPPCAENIKLNTDGCWYRTSRNVGFGGLFKDANAVELIIKGNLENYPQSVMINDAHAILNRTGTTLAHTYREANHCADHLARIGTEQNKDLVVSVNQHLSLREFMIRDGLHLRQLFLD
ncbi:hypothetical protein RHMOL_Rhmol13G0119700 [Rhododendron molle]|uniref:Uncharacterized protein n=1 Tax=Rhododendron molle TaxID=49168 RepID=A0ACC0L5N4_RHOML|nr:hypothetical protein RHMOL_Rhmol13G0119700 [Rhododendron molle]